MTLIKQRGFIKVKEIIQSLQRLFEDISKAAGRIFSPNDDDYPETGVQPFGGDIPDEHHR
ncbi:MAG: hypothetical protein AAGE59_30565 [Cyanobacteria bacterium P01_F01_bin.86]